MNFTKFTLISYIPGMFDCKQGAAADALVESIFGDLDQGEAMAKRATAALFSVKSHHQTYQALLLQLECKRRRAGIDRYCTLLCNYKAAKDAFEFFAARTVHSAEALAAVLPALTADCHYTAKSSDINNARECNCVLLSRFLLAINEILAENSLRFTPEDKSIIAGGASDLWSLKSAALEIGNYSAHRFAPPLDIPFISGAVTDPAHTELEKCLSTLHTVAARGSQCLRVLTDAKSRLSNDEQFNARMCAATGPEESNRILEQFNADTLDFESAHWALKIASSAIFYAHDACEKALQAADKRLTWHKYAAVLQNNIVSAKCQMQAALRLRNSMREQEDALRGERSMRAFKARKAALRLIPANFNLSAV